MFVQVERPNGHMSTGYMRSNMRATSALLEAAEGMGCGYQGREERICLFITSDAIPREFGTCSTRMVRGVAVPDGDWVRVYVAKIEAGEWLFGSYVGAYKRIAR